MERFDGKNITRFLKVYTYEMEIYQVPKDKMIVIFDLAIVPKIRKRVKQLHGRIYVKTWTRSKESLRDKYFDDDI